MALQIVRLPQVIAKTGLRRSSMDTNLHRAQHRALLDFNPAEGRAMRALLSLAEQQGALEIVVDLTLLAEKLKSTRNAVNWHLHQLAKKEWIVRETCPGKKGPRRIRINAAKLGEPPSPQFA